MPVGLRFVCGDEMPLFDEAMDGGSIFRNSRDEVEVSRVSRGLQGLSTPLAELDSRENRTRFFFCFVPVPLGLAGAASEASLSIAAEPCNSLQSVFHTIEG